MHSVRRVGLIAMLVAAVVAALPAPAGASYRDRQIELERLIRDKRAAIQHATAREHGILDDIQASDVRRAKLQRALDVVEAKLSIARDRLIAVERSLDKTTAALAAKTGELEDTLGALQDEKVRLNAHVSALYMTAPSSFGRVYSMAQSFADVVAASQYQVNIVRNEQETVDRIEAARAQIEIERADIAAKQDELAAKRQEALEVTQHIAEIVRERANARGAVLAEIAHRRVLLSIVRSQKSQYKRALDSLVAESRSIADLLRGAQRGQRVIQGRGGYLKWPVSGRITSGFGWRTHPIYGYRSFHTGIDIGVPSGTRVKAARYGRVLYTGYKGAYGLVVLIDHGNSLATMYAHLSRVYVRAGERVSTLEVVAASGNTGWSTGPHLHFEVRSAGEPVNPIRWL